MWEGGWNFKEGLKLWNERTGTGIFKWKGGAFCLDWVWGIPHFELSLDLWVEKKSVKGVGSSFILFGGL